MAAPLSTMRHEAVQATWPLDRIEVRFESDAAFQRGLALAGAGGGVSVCRADREGRCLVLRLEPGRESEPQLLH